MTAPWLTRDERETRTGGRDCYGAPVQPMRVEQENRGQTLCEKSC